MPIFSYRTPIYDYIWCLSGQAVRLKNSGIYAGAFSYTGIHRRNADMMSETELRTIPMIPLMWNESGSLTAITPINHPTSAYKVARAQPAPNPIGTSPLKR